MPLKLLITENKDFSPEALKILNSRFDVISADLERQDLLNELQQVNILWVRLRHYIGREIFEKVRNLKYIVSPTTGLNHIDIEVAKQNGVEILSLKGEFEFLRNIRATAEHTIGLMLSLLRNIPGATKHTSCGLWNRDLFKGSELYGKKVGLIGFGRIGKIVAKYLAAFDVDVLVTDHKPVEDNFPHVRFVSFSEILTKSDIISIHVNLNKGTVGMLDEDAFSKMKTGAILVNTSRGEVVEESWLLKALENNKLSGAALDVLCDEHMVFKKDNPLVLYSRHNNKLLITPHIGGCTKESMEKTEVFMAEKLLKFLYGDSGLK